MLHMTILYIYGFTTLSAYYIFESHMMKLMEIILMFGTYDIFMSHMTILYIYGFITLSAYDIFESHMTKLTEIILMFGT